MYPFVGFLAGFLHVLTGPDHVAAVAPYSIANRMSAWKVGFSWGTGHMGGVVLVAILSAALRGILPIERLSAVSERLVGVVLIGVGLWSLRAAFRNRVHIHTHSHEGSEHVHMHAHPPGHEHGTTEAHRHTHKAFAIGTLHGLAGSSHLFGVLPALALPSFAASAAYLIGFGAGTILAMTCLTWALGLLSGSRAVQGTRLYQGLMGACGVAALVVGGIWLAQ